MMIQVTAIMATKNRRPWVNRSIQSLLQQVRFYGDVTIDPLMVVVDDGEDDVGDLCRHDNVLYLRSGGCQAAKVNHAIEFLATNNVSSDVYAVWDDDDIHHPLRLVSQTIPIKTQAENGEAAACQLRRVHWYDVIDKSWRMHVADAPIDATCVFTHRLWGEGRPPEKDDWVRSWMEPWIEAGKVAVLDTQGLYTVVRHGGNMTGRPSFDNDNFVRLIPGIIPDHYKDICGVSEA